METVKVDQNTDTKPQDDECIVVIKGVRYDLTKWVPYHPGGDYVLKKYNGLDATDAFFAFHSEEAIQKLSKMSGTPLTEEETKESVKDNDFEELKALMNKEGLLDPSPLFYTYKTLETLGFMIAGVILLVYGYWLPSAISMGIFWQQSGWLSHEYCHHSVFKNRKYNNWMGFLMGNLLQGYSITWWKDRHNTHHAITNVVDSDPDIDNLPLFIWTKHDFHKLVYWGPTFGKVLQYQAFYFVPFCFFLRLIWCLQSILFTSYMKTSPSKVYQDAATFERRLIIIHWVLVLSMIFTFCPSYTAMVYYFLISEMIGGFGIAIIVFFNHYACEHFPDCDKKKLGFVEMQLRSTRNAKPNPVIDWIAGGLNYQIEHHLFPTMARNKLFRAGQIIQEYCKTNNKSYSYQACTFWEGLVILHKHLWTIGQEVPRYIAKAKQL